MGGGAQFLKRIPRIKFPQRNPKSSTSGSTSKTQDASSASLWSDVPAPPKNAAVGGKASLQPERTTCHGQRNRCYTIGWMRLMMIETFGVGNLDHIS